MGRVKGTRGSTNAQTVAFVCEGTDTEPAYLDSLIEYVSSRPLKRYEKMMVIPIEKEPVANEKKTELRIHRSFESAKDFKYHYYSETGDDAKDKYDKFKSQPMRYVREAELCIVNGYGEAWAIFDKDKHKWENAIRAFEHAKTIENLYVAFAAYSFEEWYLLHFEQNPFAFQLSDGNDDEISIGGRLREKKYIEHYNKKMPDLFKKVTLPQLSHPIIPPCYLNSMWSRVLTRDMEYKDRNPYCDIDMMVAHLLGEGYHKELHRVGEPLDIELNRSRLQLLLKDENTLYITNLGDTVAAIRGLNILYCVYENNDIKQIGQENDVNNLYQNGDSCEFRIPDEADYMIVKDTGLSVVVFKPLKVVVENADDLSGKVNGNDDD